MLYKYLFTLSLTVSFGLLSKCPSREPSSSMIGCRNSFISEGVNPNNRYDQTWINTPLVIMPRNHDKCAW